MIFKQFMRKKLAKGTSYLNRIARLSTSCFA